MRSAENPELLTFGQLPSRDNFNQAYEDELGDGLYEVRNDDFYGNHDFTRAELWKAVQEQCNKFLDEADEDAGHWVSNVLSTLNFYWI